MFLGVEIGGTKLQVGVGLGEGSIVELVRRDVDRTAGAYGILQQLAEVLPTLASRYPIARVGVGFGGPIDPAAGHTITSHQIAGWDDYPLAAWIRERVGLLAQLGNDADLAALAEARFGAGRGSDPVFYITVGTGIGGGFVRRGELHVGHGPAAAEIGHLRPGPTAVDPHDTVESIASGLAIERAAAVLADDPVFKSLGGRRITARELAEAAQSGHAPSKLILDRATTTLGWAVAQVVTLLSPEIVVIGGGVALLGEAMFYEPVRRAAAQFVFPPLRRSLRIAAPELGETTVVHGALALARDGAAI